MKKVSILFALGLVVIFPLILTTCDGWTSESDPLFGNTFDYYLRGTWVSNQDYYADAGTLVIRMDSIRITGFEPKEEVPAAEQPFRNFTQNVSLEGYSKAEGELSYLEGKGSIHIYDRMEWQPGIDFTYYSAGFDKLLKFTFAGRQEILRKISD